MTAMTGKYAAVRCPSCFAPAYRPCREDGRSVKPHPARKRKVDGQPVRAKRKQRPRQAVTVRKMKRTVPRAKAGRTHYEVAGPFSVTVRSKRNGGRVTWRTGLPWNEAQRLAAAARRANYGDVRIKRTTPAR